MALIQLEYRHLVESVQCKCRRLDIIDITSLCLTAHLTPNILSRHYWVC